LQQVTARLLHIQTDREIELPQNLSVIHMGKPNDRIPPDVDVSGFPNSEIVSRIHADIRVEGDAHYIEDVGSSNGTYINNLPLLPGNRHRLRPGDRISLGKGDMVTFLFQLV
jgi:pSer/pThr/pTyr-binding forkhead associated (FHA) protein